MPGLEPYQEDEYKQLEKIEREKLHMENQGL